MLLIYFVEKAFFVLALLAPAFIVFAKSRFPQLKLRESAIFFLSILFVNAFILAYVQAIGIRVDQELSQFDLDGDGFFSGRELTYEQNNAMDNVSNDTARSFAPFTAIIFAFFYVAVISIPYSILRDVFASRKNGSGDVI